MDKNYNLTIYEENKKEEDSFLESYNKLFTIIKSNQYCKPEISSYFNKLTEDNVRLNFQKYLYENINPSLNLVSVPKNQYSDIQKIKNFIETISPEIFENKNIELKFNEDAKLNYNFFTYKFNNNCIIKFNENENFYNIDFIYNKYLKSYKEEKHLKVNNELNNLLKEDIFGIDRNKYEIELNDLFSKIKKYGIHIFNLYEIFDSGWLNLMRNRFKLMNNVYKNKGIYSFYQNNYEKDLELKFLIDFISNKKYGNFFNSKNVIMCISYLDFRGNYYPVLVPFNVKYGRIDSVNCLLLSNDKESKNTKLYFGELYFANYDFLKDEISSLRNNLNSLHF